ncbi:MAG: DUF2283 domain-containing protein [Betaproteobacteria bacterium]|nr:DUF2283 domain-containing protein [Betaproteobacteria bacterium]
MKMQYDEKADALYLRLNDSKIVESEEVIPSAACTNGTAALESVFRPQAARSDGNRFRLIGTVHGCGGHRRSRLRLLHPLFGLLHLIARLFGTAKQVLAFELVAHGEPPLHCGHRARLPRAHRSSAAILRSRPTEIKASRALAHSQLGHSRRRR